MAVIEIPDEHAVLRFEGELVAGPVTTAFDHTGAQRPRWLEASLYERAAGGFVVAQVNLSLVWHQPDAPGRHIRKPGRLASASLPDGAVYCGDVPPKPGRDACPPLRTAAGARPLVRDPFSAVPAAVLIRPETVLTELPQRKLITCRDWRGLIERISTVRPGSGGDLSLSLSMPMQQLISEAVRNRPDLAEHVVMEL